MKRSLLIVVAALPLTVACGTKPNTDDTGSPSVVDRDGDGFTSDVDCDDTNPEVYPDAPEICDDLDNDCDAEVDEDGVLSYLDADQDGYGDPASEELLCEEDLTRVSNGDDCDDSDPLVNPDAEEICDGIDNDCDSETDAVGLASFTDPNGVVADYSDLVMGNLGAPAALTLSGGRLSFCEGSYFVNIDVTGPVEIVGHSSESGEVVLDAGGVNNVITSVESVVDLSVSGVTLTGGVGWVDAWGDRAGGAISVHTNGGTGSVVLSDVEISGNTASTGGGLYIWGADATLTDVEIFQNSANWSGGALLTDGAVSLKRVNIQENYAGYAGGVTVFGSTVSNLAEFEDVTLLDNTSDWGAAALYLGANIVVWTASSPGASAVLGNTDQQPSSDYSGAIEISVGEITVTGVDFGEEDSPDNNVVNDIMTGSTAAFNAGDGASFSCDESGCGATMSQSIGGASTFTGLNPSTAAGQVFRVDAGKAATLNGFSFDYFSGKECGSGTLSLLAGSSLEHGKSSSWTVMDSSYSSASEGQVYAYFGLPLRSNGVYAVVFSPNCSASSSTASLGFGSMGNAVDVGFGEAIGTVNGNSGSSTMLLTYFEGSQNSGATYDATLESVELD